jgi:hypothetical protein
VALAENLKAQFQPVADQSDPAVIETVDVALRAYSYEPASETISTKPSEVQDDIRDLKISKERGPDGIPNRALKHLPQRMILLLVALFNAILRTQYFPPVWKRASHLHSETREEPGTNLLLSAHKSSRHD